MTNSIISKLQAAVSRLDPKQLDDLQDWAWQQSDRVYHYYGTAPTDQRAAISDVLEFSAKLWRMMAEEVKRGEGATDASRTAGPRHPTGDSAGDGGSGGEDGS